MTFRTAGICMPFLMATLVSSSRLHPQDSVEMLTDIVISVQEYVRSGCVFFLCPTTSGKFLLFSSLLRTSHRFWLLLVFHKLHTQTPLIRVQFKVDSLSASVQFSWILKIQQKYRNLMSNVMNKNTSLAFSRLCNLCSSRLSMFKYTHRSIWFRTLCELNV